jgi:predicted nucleic acid-binding Zn ribbon protein
MEKLSGIIARLMRQEGYERPSREGPVFKRWSVVVGDLLTEKSRPMAVRKGVLVVQVSDSVWMHELQMQKSVIMERICDLVGPDVVLDIRWTIRGDRPIRGARKKLQGRPAAPRRCLNMEERAWVQAVSTQTKDPDLRTQIERLLTKFLQRRHTD